MAKFSRDALPPLSDIRALGACALLAFLFMLIGVCPAVWAQAAQAEDDVLRVCADPANMPQSNKRGEGYENKIAEALARDLKRRVEYTFFPQRIGFVRNTLRNRDESTGKYACDLIMGVPKGYELTATTRPYMHSIYAMVFPGRGKLQSLQNADDLLKLPPETVQSLRIGVFVQSPGADWLLRNKLLTQGEFYQQQTGDPEEHPASIVERELAAGNIDLAIVWGPVAGFLASRHGGAEGWRTLAFKRDPAIKFDYEIAMGVRRGEKEWQETLDQWITGHQQEIREILTSYGVPLVQGSAKSAAAETGDPD